MMQIVIKPLSLHVHAINTGIVCKNPQRMLMIYIQSINLIAANTCCFLFIMPIRKKAVLSTLVPEKSIRVGTDPYSSLAVCYQRGDRTTTGAARIDGIKKKNIFLFPS